MSITFDDPRALWLLVLVPVLFWIGRSGSVALPRAVHQAAIIIRLVVTTTLILVLAQPVLHRPSDTLSVIFVVDHSASMTRGGINAATQWLAQALRAKGPHDHVGIVDFGKTAVVQQPLGVNQASSEVSAPNPSASNLAAGIHLATTLLPRDGAHRIVVLSDGQANAGDAAEAAREASVRNTQIAVVPIGPSPGFPEVLIDSLTTPPAVRRGQSFDVSALVRSTTATSATLTFFMDGTQVSARQVTVHPGLQRYWITLALNARGFHTFQATIQSPHDTYPQNNTAYAFTVVHQAGHVAVVAANPSEAAPIVQALQRSQVQVTTMAPSAIPPSLSAMQSFDALVLVDTPATDFSSDQMATIVGFTHDRGGGLVVIGGPHSYGLGQYHGTPLATALPVSSGVPGNLAQGSVALMLVIDKSGSMAETMGGVEKMAAADKAAQLATDMLAPTDQIGVIAFDTDPTTVVPLEAVGSPAHRAQIERTVGQIQASGGTDIYSALKAAYSAIRASHARYKHIILMSDGDSLVDSNYAPLLQKIHQDKITLSTIAIGSDADKKLMKMLATKGGGKYYYTDAAATIPEITTHEAQVTHGSAIVKETFRPRIVAPSPLLDGVTQSALPNLHGYVVATPRSGASVVLQSDRQDPILVEWNYGVGRVVAWMSDLSSPWGRDWVKWSNFTRFWSRAVGWSMRSPGDPNMQISDTVQGNAVTLVVDDVNSQGVYQDLLDLRAQVTNAHGQTVEIPLAETRPGRYEHTFTIDQPGAYPVTVLQYQAGKVVAQEATGIVFSYPAEYRTFGINSAQLTALAALTGGQVLHQPAEAFGRQGLRFIGTTYVPLWRWLLGIVAILFPIDVAIRRLRIDPSNLGKRGFTRVRRYGGYLVDWTTHLRSHRFRRETPLQSGS